MILMQIQCRFMIKSNLKIYFQTQQKGITDRKPFHIAFSIKLQIVTAMDRCIFRQTLTSFLEKRFVSIVVALDSIDHFLAQGEGFLSSSPQAVLLTLECIFKGAEGDDRSREAPCPI